MVEVTLLWRRGEAINVWHPLAWIRLLLFRVLMGVEQFCPLLAPVCRSSFEVGVPWSLLSYIYVDSSLAVLHDKTLELLLLFFSTTERQNTDFLSIITVVYKNGAFEKKP